MAKGTGSMQVIRVGGSEPLLQALVGLAAGIDRGRVYREQDRLRARQEEEDQRRREREDFAHETNRFQREVAILDLIRKQAEQTPIEDAPRLTVAQQAAKAGVPDMHHDQASFAPVPKDPVRDVQITLPDGTKIPLAPLRYYQEAQAEKYGPTHVQVGGETFSGFPEKTRGLLGGVFKQGDWVPKSTMAQLGLQVLEEETRVPGDAYTRALHNAIGKDYTPEEELAFREKWTASNRDPSLAAIAGLRLGELEHKVGEQKKIREMPPDLRLLADKVTAGVTGTRRQAVQESIARQWVEQGGKEEKDQDLSGLKNYIVQAAIEGEGEDAQRTYEGRRDAIQALNSIEKDLIDLKKQGIDTGWAKGSLENLARRLGKSTDKRLAIIGNKISSAMYDYRRSMTGVSFSFTESGQYERLFPSYKNDPPLNLALIKGLRDGMTQTQKNFWKQKVGEPGMKFLGIDKEFEELGAEPGAGDVDLDALLQQFQIGGK